MTYIQWSTPDDRTYFPIGKTTNILPPGCYSVQESMQGPFLQKQSIKKGGLIKLPDSSSEKVVNEIKKFWNSKNLFLEHNMPYKRGILMYGPPGSGKTSAIREVMEDVEKRDGISLEFNYPSTFMAGYNMIRDIHEDRPIVALIEDIDSVINRCSESEFLNVLDGVHDLNNVVFLATTNYPERLGSRIFNRPSRFDKRFEIGMPSPECRKVYLEAKGVESNHVGTWVKDTDGLSIAHLAELYTAVKVLGESYDEAIEIIKGMTNIPHSSLFDASKIVESYPEDCTKDGCYAKAYMESKNKAFGSGILNESKTSKSKLIESRKSVKSKRLVESKQIFRSKHSNIDAIADMM